MYFNAGITIKTLNLEDKKNYLLISKLLSVFDLKIDKDIDCTWGAFYKDELIGTISIFRNIIKCFAVLNKYQEEGIGTLLLNETVTYLQNRGIHHFFVFTRPSMKDTFTSFGFKELSFAKQAVLLEMGSPDIETYKRYLLKYVLSKQNTKSGAVVVNCNPMTVGHLYLLKQAKQNCDRLHVFVVTEDSSTFPFDVRYAIVQKEASKLKGVFVHKTGEYLVSKATFSSYFTREEDIAATQAELDVRLFAMHIVPVLNIKIRFVGEEPYCPVTYAYNKAMEKILPEYGVELKIIKRLCINGEVISASKVREFLRNDKLEEVKNFVPPATYEFLKSESALPVILKLKQKSGRH